MNYKIISRLFLILAVQFLCQCDSVNQNDVEKVEYGSIIEYYEDGNLKHKGQTINGEWNGEHKWYYSSGEIELSTNYKYGIENGKQYFFYDKSNRIKAIQTKINGVIVDTTFYFLENSELQAYQIFNSNGELEKKAFYDKGEKLMEERFFVKVHYNKSPLLNTFIKYDQDGFIDNTKSVYFTFSKMADRVFVKDEMDAFCELTYNGEFQEKYILIYGDMDKEFFFDDSNVDTISFKGDKVKFPLSTKTKGHNIARFRIEDWKWGVHPQNPEKGEGYMKRFVHGVFEYYVE